MTEREEERAAELYEGRVTRTPTGLVFDPPIRLTRGCTMTIHTELTDTLRPVLTRADHDLGPDTVPPGRLEEIRRRLPSTHADDTVAFDVVSDPWGLTVWIERVEIRPPLRQRFANFWSLVRLWLAGAINRGERHD